MGWAPGFGGRPRGRHRPEEHGCCATCNTEWSPLGSTWPGCPPTSSPAPLPNGSEGPRARVQIVVDQVDAAARTVLGGLLDDDQLQADGARRRVAAKQRLAALRRRDVPDEQRAKTDRRVAEARTKAKDHRGQAQSVAKAAIDEVAQQPHASRAADRLTRQDRRGLDGRRRSQGWEAGAWQRLGT